MNRTVSSRSVCTLLLGILETGTVGLSSRVSQQQSRATTTRRVFQHAHSGMSLLLLLSAIRFLSDNGSRDYSSSDM